MGIAVWLLYLIRSTLLPFLTAFFVAYIVGPLVDGMESKGIKRIIGVLILYITLLIFTVSASLFVGPFLVHEIQDLSQRVAGEKRDWTFSISNVGGQDLTVEKIESSQKIGLDIINPTDFPLIVEPFKQVKVMVRFSPPTAKPVWTQLQIYSNDPKRANDPVGIWLEANRPSSSLPREHVDLQWESNAYWPVIAVSDTAWYIGEVEPSYLAKFMDKIRALQPQFVGYLPILRGVDLAEEVSIWVSKTSTNLVKQTPELIGGLISWITYVVIVPFVVFFLLNRGRDAQTRPDRPCAQPIFRAGPESVLPYR